MSESDFEKLGVFYLGRGYDLGQKNVTNELCLYDSKDLVTHGVCIGMTGSGKTGLCLGLLEEAAIDGIPVIAIDPKGDIGNLMLTFPQLDAKSFEPWVDADQARRNSLTVPEFATQEAARWTRGLQQWDQDSSRIQRLRDAADVAIYTPGSSAGLQVSILKSFATPPDAVLDDSDDFNDRITTAASSLLSLLGITADPLRSREHILISNILNNSWRAHTDLTLASLIQAIQKPPITQIGALDLESFFPAKDRFKLAMDLNNLVASPGFESWMQGEALDIDKILYTDAGKPRIAIFSVAHLDDTQRMFFVALLLNQFVSWMRAQSGTSSLRAIVYMDEIFGYFPPVSNPPSKTPLLTMLKQGRAFGVGVLLATQNPVDLDYKGLANAGTWFIGRLQTERDKLRVLDGLEGAAANSGTGFDRAQMDKTMSALGNRVFLMNNVHEDKPAIFQTRWTLSYLRGPLTREQIKLLMSPSKALGSKSSTGGSSTGSSSTGSSSTSNSSAGSSTSAGSSSTGAMPPSTPIPSSAPAAAAGCSTHAAAVKPIVAPGIPEYFLPVRVAPDTGDSIIYKPALLGIGNVRFLDTKSTTDSTLQYALLATASSDSAQPINWDNAQPAKVWTEDLQTGGQGGAFFEGLPPGFGQPKSYAGWTKDFAAWLAATKKIKLFKSEITGQYSKPRESERDFRVRLAQSAREARDAAVADLKDRYAPKLSALQERLRRAQQALEREQLQARDEQIQSAISVGTTVLGALMGRKKISSTTIARAGTAARRVGKTMREQQDVAQANDTVSTISASLDELNAAFAQEMAALEGKFDPLKTALTEITILPKKANVSVPILGLAWAPYVRKSSGCDTPAWMKSASPN